MHRAPHHGRNDDSHYAFRNCEDLTSVILPSTIKEIGQEAFWECKNLTLVSIPEGVTTIGDYAFYACDSLKTLILPSSIKSIGDRAFDLDYNTTIQDGDYLIVVSKTKSPVTLKEDPWDHRKHYYNIKLIIPLGSESEYANSSYWPFSSYRSSVFKTFAHDAATFAEAENIDLDKAYKVADETTFAAADESDLKAYQFKSAVGSDNTIVGTKVNGIVPAGTGLLLKGTEGATYVFPLTNATATADVADNKLVGVTTDLDMSTVTGGYIYKNDAFYPCSSGTLSANKAYLNLGTAAAAKINIVFDDETTGINDIKAESSNSSAWYTIDGKRLNSKPTTKGLYINNGKKFIIK